MDFAMLDQDTWFRLLEYLLWVVCQFYAAAVLVALVLIVFLFGGEALNRPAGGPA
ncbi:MAG: hypothetical protein AAB225_21415 [Acidobacteriota bacterium]